MYRNHSARKYPNPLGLIMQALTLGTSLILLRFDIVNNALGYLHNDLETKDQAQVKVKAGFPLDFSYRHTSID